MLKSIIYLNNSDVKGINSVLSIFVKSLQKQWWFVCVSEKEKSRDADWSASRQIGICQFNTALYPFALSPVIVMKYSWPKYAFHEIGVSIYWVIFSGYMFS